MSEVQAVEEVKPPARYCIVTYEWQGCQQFGFCQDASWHPTAVIFPSGEHIDETMLFLGSFEKPRFGQLTYRNIRGPFPWQEPSP